MAVNCDLIIAPYSASFGLPEVRRGLVAVAGSLPRLVRVVGRRRASDMVLTGRSVAAETTEAWGLVNEVVHAPDNAVDAPIRSARPIATNSPDAVLVSRKGLMLGRDGVGDEEAPQALRVDFWDKIKDGENAKEGIRAFAEKRQPVWLPSVL